MIFTMVLLATCCLVLLTCSLVLGYIAVGLFYWKIFSQEHEDANDISIGTQVAKDLVDRATQGWKCMID